MAELLLVGDTLSDPGCPVDAAPPRIPGTIPWGEEDEDEDELELEEDELESGGDV